MHGELLLENSEEENPDFLKTIMVPQNMHYLTDKLPTSNYNPLLTRLSNKMDYVNVNAKYIYFLLTVIAIH